MVGSPSFSIPSRPRRHFPFSGGVEYEGQTLFRLLPDQSQPQERLVDLVEALLEAGPYRYGDFMNLPMPLYLVRDEDTGDVFRVSIRDGCIRLHVLPETDSVGLRTFFERVDERSDHSWRVECEWTPPDE